MSESDGCSGKRRGSSLVTYSQRTFTASFKADPELWSQFKETCVSRGVSICHVLEALMTAWMEGQKVTATVIKPVVVNLTMQHVVQRPRRLARYPGPEITESIGCHRLEHRDWGLGYLGWCHYIKRWITVGNCARCPRHGEP